jgi:hypothetical protein
MTDIWGLGMEGVFIVITILRDPNTNIFIKSLIFKLFKRQPTFARATAGYTCTKAVDRRLPLKKSTRSGDSVSVCRKVGWVQETLMFVGRRESSLCEVRCTLCRQWLAGGQLHIHCNTCTTKDVFCAVEFNSRDLSISFGIRSVSSETFTKNWPPEWHLKRAQLRWFQLICSTQ